MPPAIEVAIGELGADGYGVGWWEDRPVRVKGALPGERVTARVLKKSRGTVFAEIIDGLFERSAKHPDRVAATCNHFPRCGGCVFHHLDYAAQVRHKTSVVLETLAASGITPLAVAEPMLGYRAGYRRKARLGVRAVGDQVFVGFRETLNARVVDVPTCRVLEPPIGAALHDLSATLAVLDGRARIPQIEVAAGDVEVQFCVRHLDPLSSLDRVRLLEFGQRNGIEMLAQAGGLETVRRLVDDTAPSPLHYVLPRFGLDLTFAPTAFVQVNASVNERVVDHVVAAVDPTPGSVVIDLFCGIGNLSLPLAKLGARVIGYENVADAVTWARRNAQHNHLEARTSFQVLDLYQSDFDVAASAWVIDPPRSGAGPRLVAWLRQKPERIAYVSCNPATFASDGVILERHGYRLSNLTMFDMFPHTAHIEVMGTWILG